jgi:hypothetical protein
LLQQVVDALQGINNGLGIRENKKVIHRASNYMIDNGKLWYLGGGTPTRAITRRECVSQSEAVELARQEHENSGHFHRDLIKITLLDKIHSPKLDRSIIYHKSSVGLC